VIKKLTPLFSNPRTELSKMPKIYFADTGLRNLAMGSFSDLRTRSDTDKIIEGIVASHVLRNRLLSHRVNYWKTKSGAEVDFIISGVKPVQSIEVKSGILKHVMISRGYRSLLSKYYPEKAILLNSTIWSEKEINGYTVEAIPTAVFLLREARECTPT